MDARSRLLQSDDEWVTFRQTFALTAKSFCETARKYWKLTGKRVESPLMDSGSGKKILIIEDEKDVADLLALNLRKAGFRISLAADGVNGLERAREDRPASLFSI